MRLRVCVHALDRTGPPMLTRSLLDWVRGAHPEIDIDVVAFRGGAMLTEFVDRVPTTVLLHPFESWDGPHSSSDSVRRIRSRVAKLDTVDATLLVSISSAQVIAQNPEFRQRCGTVIAWVVEQGEDLHWLSPPHSYGRFVDAWIAGSETTRLELVASGVKPPIAIAPEFVDEPPAISDAQKAARRRHLGVGLGEFLVLGAGIATHRKAPDLFVEVALGCRRVGIPVRFAWIGGEHDELFAKVCAEADALDLDNLAFLGSVADLDAWIAASDVLCHPARLDAFPLVCLHAAALSVPVVGFGGTGWMEDMFGSAGLGAPFPDVSGLVGAIGALLDREDRADAGRRQRAAIGRHLSGDAAGREIFAALSATRRAP